MINKISELNKIYDYLEKRQLLNQYKKAKKYILEWNIKNVDLKYREPKELWIIYFKITKKYRAWWRKDWDHLIIFKIDDHQN